MNPNRIAAVIRKESQEILSSRGLLLAIFVPPLVMTILPLAAIYIVQRVTGAEGGSASANEFGRLLAQMPEMRAWSASEVALFIILQQFLTFFLMMPLIIPMSIAAQSIVGEKQARSLEPLLATPVQTGELLFAKAVSAMLPGLLGTWAAFLLFLLGGRFIIQSERVFDAMLNPRWLIAMTALAPLLSLLSVTLAVVLSSRVNDTRAVQQIGGFIVLPVVLLGVAQTTGFILLNATTFVLGAVLVAALDLAILALGVRLFQREKILTQWK